MIWKLARILAFGSAVLLAVLAASSFIVIPYSLFEAYPRAIWLLTACALLGAMPPRRWVPVLCLLTVLYLASFKFLSDSRWASLSTVTADPTTYPNSSVGHFAIILLVAGVYAIACRILPDMRTYVRRFFVGYVACLSALALADFASVQFAKSSLIISGRDFNKIDWVVPRDSMGFYTGAYRSAAIAVYPNLLGNLILLIWPLTVAGLAQRRSSLEPLGRSLYRRVARFLPLILLVLMVGALLVTYSRSAYVGFLLQCFALLCVAGRGASPREKALSRTLIVGACGVFVIGLAVVPYGLRRLIASVDLQDASVTNRLSAWETILWAVAERPYSGWGNLAPSVLLPRYTLAPGLPEGPYLLVHSELASLLCATGVPVLGLIALAVFGLAWRWHWSFLLPRLAVAASLVSLSAENLWHTGMYEFTFGFVLGEVLRTGCEVEASVTRGLRWAALRRRGDWLLWLRRPGILSGALSLALLCLYLAEWRRPLPSPDEWFAKRLSSLLPRWSARYAYWVEDYTTGRHWSSGEGKAFEAWGLRDLAVACAVAQVELEKETTASCQMPVLGVEPGSRDCSTSSQLTLARALRSGLSGGDEAAMRAVERWLRNRPLPEFMRETTGSLFSGEGGLVLEAREVARLMEGLTKSDRLLGAVARDALLNREPRLGLARWLDGQFAARAYSYTDGGDTYVYDVVRVKGAGADWIAVVLMETRREIPTRDSPEWRALARFGWTCARYLGGVYSN
ncbi:MAG: hypothetical protein KatS3mg130_1114 [Candidatus Sumerlaea sp.]|nr:O-antigen ligase family protein [Candidatus Sumerlaea chitinivorans]GIX44706.1 MAG: hypothetical protein KatS3mg130_1114 [Candidatus Sumerlaea sp.]